MTDLVTRPELRVQDIQRLLRESYGSGFTIFKELVQNAEDAQALRLVLAGHGGFAAAQHPLLRAQGLFIANDGAVTSANWQALQFASGGGKASDHESVGRFGLGQKALYHLCDAFVVFGRITDAEDTVTSMVLNPYENVGVAKAVAGTHWLDPLCASDEALLSAWAKEQGLDRGLALYVPLRTANLRPGPGSEPGATLALRDRNWTPDEAIRDILDGEQLPALLSCLRRLERIDIRPLSALDRQFVVSGDTRRLEGPGAEPERDSKAAISGTVMTDRGKLRFLGHQAYHAQGRAAALLGESGWPEVFDMENRLVKPKATPHGAAIVCRSPLVNARDVARLRLWQAVYLPLGDPTDAKVDRRKIALVDVDLEQATDNIDLVVHGDFFVSSDRASLRKDDGIESRWNKALLEETALPCVLDAVAATVQDLAADKERYALVRALDGSVWWSGNAGAVCGARALARCGQGARVDWAIVEHSSLRPIPNGATTGPNRLKAAWSGFEAWCAEQDITLAYGTILAAQPARWSDSELAAIVRGIGGAAFTDGKIAETLADILKFTASGILVGYPETQRALGEAWRAAAHGAARLAPVESLRQLVPLLSKQHVLILPKLVQDRGLMALLAAVEPTLCVKEEWFGEPPLQRRLPMDEAVAMLAALEPAVADDSKRADQALAVVAEVMRQGPKMDELARHNMGCSLKVVPVVQVSDGAQARITPLAVQALVGRKLLFQTGPAKALPMLANAIAVPAIFQLRQNFPTDMMLASGNAPADRCAVVEKADRFGPAAARAEVIKDIGGQLQPPLLRKLVAGDADLKNVVLAELDELDSVLEPLIAALVGSGGEMRLIAPEVAAVLTKQLQQAISLHSIDVRRLADLLEKRGGALPSLDEAQAIALLKAGLPLDRLRPLKLHRAEGSDALFPASALVVGQLKHVPEKLQAQVRLAALWPDNDAQAVQRKLIDEWGLERQIDLALAAPCPYDFMEEIIAALAGGAALTEERRQALAKTRWLAVGAAPCAPADVRDLPEDAMTALRSIDGVTVPVALEALSPDLNKLLTRHQLVPDRHASFARALFLTGRAGAVGLALDPPAHWPAARWADLRKLARARCDLGGGVWPLLASALRAVADDEIMAQWLGAAHLAAPDRDAIVTRMNALAQIAIQPASSAEPARHLHKALYDINRLTLIGQGGFLPPNLFVLNEEGGFGRADQLALGDQSVLPSTHIAAVYGLKAPENAGPGRDSLAEAEAGRMILTDVIGNLLAPFTPFHELYPGVVMVLAMLGRSAAIRRIAENFPHGRTFDDICADLDGVALKTEAAAGTVTERLRDVRFVADLAAGGKVRVLSAAGTMCHATSDGRALLNACTLGQRIEEGERGFHVYRLALTPVKPANEQQGADLLARFIHLVAPALMMGWDTQRRELARLFASYRETDQITLDVVREEIRDALSERLAGLKVKHPIRGALQTYRDEVRAHGREVAKDNLWTASTAPDAAATLLEAIRAKIRSKNYDPSRALFELFQNAVDAARQWHARTDVHVEVTRGEDEAITLLRLIHWGRPINWPGPDPDEAFAQDHQRDLANMLAMDHSAKEGELHGRHGLGFKTVHMLSDSARVACGRLVLTIRGGLLPEDWPEGRDILTSYNRGRDLATVIDLPIPPERSGDAAAAWESFKRAAPLLPVMAPEIAQIVLRDDSGGAPLAADPHDVADGIRWIAFGPDGEDRALRLDLADGFALYVPLKQGMPAPFGPAWNRFWNLVPLDGEAPKCGWLIEGPFQIDQGRRGLAGNVDDKEARFRQLGVGLGHSLVCLYQHWADFAASAGIDSARGDEFFGRLVLMLAGDLGHEGPQRALHGAGRGLGAMLEQCPLVPLAFGGKACVGDVKWHLAGALTDPVTLDQTRPWLDQLDLAGGVVDGPWEKRLAALDYTKPAALDLATIARRLFVKAEVSPNRAKALGTVYNARAQQEWSSEERAAITQLLGAIRLQAEDGTFQPANQLAFPQDERQSGASDVERAIAAFAPPSGRLANSYKGEAVAFAQLVRSAAGYIKPLQLQQWLKTAGTDPQRALAVLRYLANDPSHLPGNVQHTPWLPRGAALEIFPPFRLLGHNEQRVLLIYLGEQEPRLTRQEPQINPRDVLQGIADWWDDEREDLIERYDQAVYPDPDLFDPQALHADDDEAWFTMLGLATFQTLGGIQPEQSRGYVERAIREGWWRDLARIEPNDRKLLPYVERLLAWSEPDADDAFMRWRRCLVDVCTIARHIDDYRVLFRALPRIVSQEGHVSLRNLLMPGSSLEAGRLGVNAANLSRSLGIGANWVVRELARIEIYPREHAQLAMPFGWSTPRRVRRLIERIGLGSVDHGVDGGWHLHQLVMRTTGHTAPFGDDGDLPLHIITLGTHRPTLADILRGSGDESPETFGSDEDDD